MPEKGNILFIIWLYSWYFYLQRVMNFLDNGFYEVYIFHKYPEMR